MRPGKEKLKLCQFLALAGYLKLRLSIFAFFLIQILFKFIAIAVGFESRKCACMHFYHYGVDFHLTDRDCESLYLTSSML